jgi:signal transduction histidine kinase/DNA-binding NarL/FixJ family response regulator
MTATIIIADTSEESAIRIRTQLIELGYTAHVTRSAAETLHSCRQLNPAIVFVSYRLPGMETGELLRVLKQSRSDLETIVICPRRTLPTAARCLKPLLSGLIGSPIHSDEMDILLRGVLERVSLRSRLKHNQKEIVRKIRRRYVKRIETERFLTVKQILDKVSTVIGELAREVEGGVRYFNEIPYFIAIHDRKCRVVAANRAYRTLLERRTGNRSWEIYDGAACGRENCPVSRTLLSENAMELRETVRYRSGAKVPVIVHTAPIYNDDGTVKLVLEISAGIQDVQQLKDGLRDTQQRYQMLFDAVPCYVAVLDTKMRFTANNSYFIHEFGNQAGVSLQDAFRFDREKFKHTPIRKTFQDGKPHHGEMTWLNADGHRYATLVWTSPILSSAGKLLQVLLVFVDITQIRDLQNNLSFLGLMIASISHSIKGVLSGLDAGVYTLEKAIAAQDEAGTQEGLVLVKHMAERIRKITLDILFYAKDRELNRSQVDLRHFATEIVSTVAPRFTRPGISLVTDIDDCAGEAEIDSGLLKAAMVNILENAVDACLADGKGKSDHRVLLKVQCGPEAIGISVEDNGIGMSPEQLKQLFTVFYSTKGLRGTGLGLFIADKIVRQHGGDMVVESSPGQGSRFCIRLPILAPVRDPAQLNKPSPPQAAGYSA